MLFTVLTIARAEFRALLKQKTFALLLAIFLLMALFSTYIGWSTNNTIVSVYKETTREMMASGIKEIPANPFSAPPPLSILKNMVVYVFLIGSLLAIVVGYSAFIRERKAEVSKIIFVRPISKFQFILGKVAGIFFTLSLVMAAAFAISWLSASLIYGHMLPSAQIFRLLVFYGISLVYIFVFSLIGLFFSIRSKSESLALLAPVVIWILISFVMPQLTSALDPTALLNPTNIQSALPQNSFFTIAQAIIHPFSISESYKLIGRSLLQEDINSYPFLTLLSYLIATMAGCFYVINKFDVCEAEIDE